MNLRSVPNRQTFGQADLCLTDEYVGCHFSGLIDWTGMIVVFPTVFEGTICVFLTDGIKVFLIPYPAPWFTVSWRTDRHDWRNGLRKFKKDFSGHSAGLESERRHAHGVLLSPGEARAVCPLPHPDACSCRPHRPPVFVPH